MIARIWGLFLVVSLVYIPEFTYARGLVPCGGEGEPACQACFVVTLVENLFGWLVAFMSVVAAILIVYAGAKLVMSNGNHHAMQEAKGYLTNIAIGYAIVLAGWLLVDTGMKALVNGTVVGVWNQLQCVQQPDTEWVGAWSDPGVVLGSMGGWSVGAGGAMTITCDVLGYSGAAPSYDCGKQTQQCLSVPGKPTTSPDGSHVTCVRDYYKPYTGGPLAQCGAGNSACSVSALMGVGLTSQQANVMSCLAITESSGNPNTPPYNMSHPGSNSSACGTFQIVRTTWNKNALGACADFYSNCQKASCNMQVAAALVKNRGGFGDWTCPGCNNKASACVAKYGGR